MNKKQYLLKLNHEFLFEQENGDFRFENTIGRKEGKKGAAIFEKHDAKKMVKYFRE